MSKMILTVGLPASGKTTYARALVEASQQAGTPFVNVNRDDIRFMLYGVYFGDPIDENQVTKVAHGVINSVFKRGGDVIVSDTNLNKKNVRQLTDLAGRWGAEVEFKFFDVNVDELVLRDATRRANGDRSVGEQVIKDMAKRYTKGGIVPRFDDLIAGGVDAVESYNGTPGKPDAIIVDLDGTVALHVRSPYDYDSLHTDLPNEPVIRCVKNEWRAGTTILFTSGRPDSHYEQTMDWIAQHINLFVGEERVELFMRKAPDKRMDAIVKQEIFDAKIRDNYNVLYCFDDRNQVVDAWRAMGLTVFQVAPGDF